MLRFLHWFRFSLSRPSARQSTSHRAVDMLDLLRALGCDE